MMCALHIFEFVHGLSNKLTCCTGSRAHLPLVEVCCALFDKQCTLYNVKYDTVQAVVHIHLWLDTHTRTTIAHPLPQFSLTFPHFSCRSLCCHQVQVTQSSHLRLFFVFWRRWTRKVEVDMTQGKIDLRNESGRPMKVKVVGEVSEK